MVNDVICTFIRDEIIDNMEGLRIDIDTECSYRDPTGHLRDKYERANEMLDDCLEIVKRVLNNINSN